jgi:hypothetical protein
MRIIIRRKATGVGFVHPLISVPKTVILAAGFRAARNIRVFADGWCDEAARFGPCAAAAPLEELQRLARKGIELRHAVVVLTYSPNSRLSDEDRDFLWEAFGVPIFEQFLGPNNELLAMECGAHDGLHVVGAVGSVPLKDGVCGCGSAVPRIMPQQEAVKGRSMVA